ncbi:kinase-like protein [Aspergillus steynii IBT 23096]|uniref:Kinase-like protein n=1 Tax=Aspergillus steynii IBT 23096 TaxID=1392250 RepID=A0A2I2GFF5_9EURO|nr:kinase-like protein [Aspergillus steynii IBT 23096]PLB51615.1 kinase-like protein [Aspergillus steynii IBT 23096]
MATTLALGHQLKGTAGFYTVKKQLQENVWSAITPHNETVIVKSVRHFRLQNECDVLRQFQHRSPYLRPLLDDIEDPPALILKHLDDDLLHASNCTRLSRLEVKHVARRVLKALTVLHADGYVHTDIKPSNVLVNYQQGESQLRFSTIQLSDFGTTVHKNSPYAENGDPIGTPIFRSPEAQLQLRWGTETDIWSFGAMVSFHIFKPDVPASDDSYDLEILMKQHRCFGPFPASYADIASRDRLAVLTWVMQNSPAETLKPFHLTTENEIAAEDREFICKIMKLDPRERMTAEGLLGDAWLG